MSEAPPRRQRLAAYAVLRRGPEVLLARIATHIEHYDCVIVGGGVGGLAAAESYRERFGEDTRILILAAPGHASGHPPVAEPGGSDVAAGHGLRSVLLFDRADFGVDTVVADRVEDRGWSVSHYYGAAQLSFVAWGRDAGQLRPFPEDGWGRFPVASDKKTALPRCGTYGAWTLTTRRPRPHLPPNRPPLPRLPAGNGCGPRCWGGWRVRSPSRC